MISIIEGRKGGGPEKIGDRPSQVKNDTSPSQLLGNIFLKASLRYHCNNSLRAGNMKKKLTKHNFLLIPTIDHSFTKIT